MGKRQKFMAKILYAETVTGADPAESNIKVHNEDPTNNNPIPCLDESGNEVPVKVRKIVGIEIDDHNIVRKFTERGFKPQTQEGLRHPVALDEYAVIGKPMPEIPEME